MDALAHRLDDATWRKSSRSENTCVEVAVDPKIVGIRDSKHVEGPALHVTPDVFANFIDWVKRTQ